MPNALFLLGSFLLLIQGVIMQAHSDNAVEREAIVLVAFGSTSPSTSKTYDKINNTFKNEFPNHHICWGFTSETVVKKLQEKGKNVLLVKDVIDGLKKTGYKSVVLQSLHIMPGEEFRNLCELKIEGIEITVGKPLLSSDKDINIMAEMLISMCDSDRPTVIAAHGNEKFPEFNKPLFSLASMIEQKCTNTVLCTIEGPPGTEPFSKILSSVQKNDAVEFIPLMLIAGVHVEEDLTGPDPESWKNLLKVSNVKIAAPLGEQLVVHQLFIAHCKDALNLKGLSK
jgi:sirohydrochlorin cobaltochelatase